ncbi:MAG TPA: 2-oxo acid dehydrogenase subunit E2, partial [Bryobacteraceae bacterium]
MQEGNDPSLGVNSWLEEELYHQYRFDRKSVDEGWTDLFVHAEDQNGAGGNGNISPEQESAAQTSVAVETEPEPAPVREPPAKPEPQKEPPKPEPPRSEPPKTELAKAAPAQPAKPEPKTVGASDQLIPLRGAAARIAENMTLSLSIPVATSQRQIPVRVIEENRNLINKRRVLKGQSKLSFTQLIAWAIVKALRSNAGLNHAYAENGGEPFRVVRGQVNLGLAIDIAAKDGTRSLKVPNIKNADGMNFAQFVAAYDDIVARARTNKLQVADFEGTTISLTNPGTVGTFGSVPRLMPGQGAIVATGVIDYP